MKPPRSFAALLAAVLFFSLLPQRDASAGVFSAAYGVKEAVENIFGLNFDEPNHYATPKATPARGPGLPGTFRPTAVLDPARQYHMAALLRDGRVLVTGGQGDSGIGVLFDAQIFDPQTAKWLSVGRMASPRSSGTATALTDGRVLVAGGELITPSGFVELLSSSEIFDPNSGTWSPGGTLSVARILHTATLLNDGRVLLAGGEDTRGNALASAELYDPSDGIFHRTGEMISAVYRHQATLLPSGKVLITGGIDITGYATNNAEVYDPGTGKFHVVGKMTTVRKDHTATLLLNGQVLVAGGEDNWGHALNSGELYNPANETFHALASRMQDGHESHTATLLTNGKVLIAGGEDGINGVTAEAELYDPSTETFTRTGAMGNAREHFTATRLNDGEVLVAGGFQFVLGEFSTLDSCELYQP